MNKVKCPLCGEQGIASLYLNGDQEQLSVYWSCNCHEEKEEGEKNVD